MFNNRIIIFANNIHSGGGKSLLFSLLRSQSFKAQVLVFFDSRIDLPADIRGQIKSIFIKPTIFHRIYSQLWLYVNVSACDRVLCFGNLPPLFRLRAKTSVFLQNRYLIDNRSLAGFNIKTKLRLLFERFRFQFCINNSDEFIVQSESMRNLLMHQKFFRLPTPVVVRPFISKDSNIGGLLEPGHKPILHIKKSYDFLYVSSGEPHKNHRNLIEAWRILAEQDLFPSLCLTLNDNRDHNLWVEIEAIKISYNLNIVNVGSIANDKIYALYFESHALIFPSILESFGLPLIEAHNAGLSILASELDYVRDILDPVQTFDPHSARSIARAVKRFMGIYEARPNIISGSEFILSLFDHDRN